MIIKQNITKINLNGKTNECKQASLQTKQNIRKTCAETLYMQLNTWFMSK